MSHTTDSPAKHKSETPAADFELPLEPFQGTPKEIERQWYEQVYKGRGDSMAQLTVRAVFMGCVLGGILSLTNIYIGLKTGFNFAVSITACILSYAVWTGLHSARIARTKMTILENNCMQSTASAAGYSTGGTLFSAFAAYILLNGHPLPFWLTVAWVFFLALLGVTMAIPMKRQMINIDQLRFPTGIATAETLRALHSHGAKGMRAAKALCIAALIAAADTFWSSGLKMLATLGYASDKIIQFGSGELLTKLQTGLFGKETFTKWSGRTIEFGWDTIWLAAGAIAGLRTCATVFISSTICWGIYVPILEHNGVLPEAGGGMGYKNVIHWTLWAGSSCMVVSGLFSLFAQWRMAVDAVKNIAKRFSKQPTVKSNDMDQIETPNLWFVAGVAVSTIGLGWLANYSFGIPYWQSVLAVILSYPLSLVACRITGETDFTPNGALGKVTQLVFGMLNPKQANINLMAANITTGAAGSSADLLTDLKSGYLLGANPRKQFIAQFAGIFIGTVVTVPVFSILVQKPSDLGGDKFPAPAALVWEAVARALSGGLGALASIKQWSIVYGAVVGIILSLLPILFPKKKNLFPSGAAVGLGWYLRWYHTFMFFLGALAVYVFRKKSPKNAEEFSFPIASGVIAGASLMGILIIFCENSSGIAAMIKQMFGGK